MFFLVFFSCIFFHYGLSLFHYKFYYLIMDIIYKEVPIDWAVCFLESCPRKEECMRFQCGLIMPDDKEIAIAVTPSVLKMKTCPRYASIEKMWVALGFQHIFDDVKAKHANELRSRITNYLGSKTTYYRCLRGEKYLTPEQQEWIKNLLAKYGYTENIEFDEYKELYCF